MVVKERTKEELKPKIEKHVRRQAKSKPLAEKVEKPV